MVNQASGRQTKTQSVKLLVPALCFLGCCITEGETLLLRMQQAAVKIDRQIGKADAPLPEEEEQQIEDQHGFQLYKPKYRKSGTGCVYQLNDHLWEGKYSTRNAHGKWISRNVYAKTEEECEAKLAAMIEEMKKQIAEEKAMLRNL